jgi:hypothetical protein
VIAKIIRLGTVGLYLVMGIKAMFFGPPTMRDLAGLIFVGFCLVVKAEP